MHRWRIGEVEITRVVETEVAVPREMLAIGDDPDALFARARWAVPAFADESGRVRFALSATCIDTGEHRVVVDPCLSFDQRLEADASEQARTFIDGRLAAAGFGPDRVDMVINTHVDGLGWNLRPDGDGGWVPTFPKATYVLSARERARVEESGGVERERLRILASSGRLESVEAPRHLCREINLAPSAGHTSGNVDVWIVSHGAESVVVGDFLVSPLQAADPEWAGLDAHPHEARRLRRALLNRCVHDEVLIVGPHFPAPGAGYAVRDGDAFRFVGDEGG